MSNSRRDRQAQRPSKPPPKPLGAARLEELALAYTARFADSAAKLADYLRRKLRERGWEGDSEGGGEPPIDAIVERFVAAGYVDDAAYARAKSTSMLRRGLGMRRVSQAMDMAGIAGEDREASRAGPGTQRRSPLRANAASARTVPRPPTGRRAKSRLPPCCALVIRWTAPANWSMRQARQRQNSGPGKRTRTTHAIDRLS